MPGALSVRKPFRGGLNALTRPASPRSAMLADWILTIAPARASPNCPERSAGRVAGKLVPEEKENWARSKSWKS